MQRTNFYSQSEGAPPDWRRAPSNRSIDASKARSFLKRFGAKRHFFDRRQRRGRITRRAACCKAEDGHHEYDFSSGLERSDIFLIVECGEADHAPSRLRQG